jgi:hypothetical protein
VVQVRGQGGVEILDAPEGGGNFGVDERVDDKRSLVCGA